MTHLTFLGSGCWQGIPTPFLDDKISKNVLWGTKDFRFRTSLQIKTDNGKNIIIELTPDIRLQSWKYQVEKPDACLISHWHWDHFFGLLDLDWFIEKHGLIVYGNHQTKKIYDLQMNHIKVDLKTFESFKPFIIDNVKITPLPVDHIKDTHGFLFEDSSKNWKVVYLPDLKSIPSSTLSLIKNVNTIIIDATYLESESHNDLTHMQKDQIIPNIKNIDANEIILSNIGSYSGLTHKDLEKKFSNYTIAYDGMKREYK